MAVVHLRPTGDHPVPFSTDEDKPASFLEDMVVAGNTVDAQMAMGALLEDGDRTKEEHRRFIKKTMATQDRKGLQSQSTAYATAEFLRTYGSSLAVDVVRMRVALTNKLAELANCGDPKYELRAIELLGKHSDIGLFTERSEVTINYKDPKSLEDAIKERVKRLLNADIIDVTPRKQSLDEELGVYDRTKMRSREEQIDALIAADEAARPPMPEDTIESEIAEELNNPPPCTLEAELGPDLQAHKEKRANGKPAAQVQAQAKITPGVVSAATPE
jgi:hypothetical protein